MTEWACRTYGWRLDYVLEGIPAIQLAMLWRCHAQGVGGLSTGTLLNDEIAKIVAAAAKMAVKNGGRKQE